MAEPTSQSNQEASRTWQWLVDGWHALRDKAVSAVTYFTPQREQEQKSQRWGVIASDITEHKDAILVELEVPGMDKADLSVEVHGDRLVVSGEKRTSETRHEGSLVVTERAYGSFKRVLPLPCEVSNEGTKAKYRDGVLTVTMPKDRSANPRAIPISRG
jgi:HSP20 family protein